MPNKKKRKTKVSLAVFRVQEFNEDDEKPGWTTIATEEDGIGYYDEARRWLSKHAGMSNSYRIIKVWPTMKMVKYKVRLESAG